MNYPTITKSLLVLLSVAFILTACKNDDPKTTEKPVVVEKPVEKPVEATAISTLRSSIAALNPTDRRAIIGSLPAHYTYALWKDRLQELMESAETTEESELLSSAYEGLQLSMYTDTAVSAQTQFFVDNTHAQALEVYGNDLMHVLSIFTTLGESIETIGIIEGAAAALPNCDCTTHGLDLECHINDTCKLGSCKVVKKACGAFNIYNCNGLCVD
ncbi:MAG: hypothetical protein ACJAXX_000580 [Roseivirga sp.]|jgi:hypothetical protein